MSFAAAEMTEIRDLMGGGLLSSLSLPCRLMMALSVPASILPLYGDFNYLLPTSMPVKLDCTSQVACRCGCLHDTPVDEMPLRCKFSEGYWIFCWGIVSKSKL